MDDGRARKRIGATANACPAGFDEGLAPAARRRPPAAGAIFSLLFGGSLERMRVASMPLGKKRMTPEEYYDLLPKDAIVRLVRMAHDFAELADVDLEAAGRKLDAADVIFAVWQAESGAFGFIPIFGGDRLVKRLKNLRLAALFAPSEIDARMLAYPHELATQ
jgi:hypothetical protein